MPLYNLLDSVNLGHILTITIGTVITFIIIFKLIEETFSKVMMFIMFVALAIIVAIIAYRFLV